MRNVSLEMRIKKLYEVLNFPECQEIDCTDAKRDLLERLRKQIAQSSSPAEGPGPLDQAMVQKLRETLQAGIRAHEEAYNVRYVSRNN